ncbi:MAG: cytochrome-c peroxidase [Sphingobacteriales bacterium]|nr:MAG: cytochrome-c peroxidase [Sphingobacteriales bacterium]
MLRKQYFLPALCLLVVLLSFKKKVHTTACRLNVPTWLPAMPLAKNNVLTKEGIALGRRLFYDPILSGDRTITCASCHKQAYAFSDGGARFSKGIDGAQQLRNTIPLFNLAWYPALFWDGRAATVEEQVFHPVRTSTEMNMSWNEVATRVNADSKYRKLFYKAFGDRPIDSTLIAFAIAQFERSLISYRSKFDRVLAGTDKLTPDEAQGFVLMNDMTKGDCLHCHTTDADALGTTHAFSNNGLDSIPTDKGRLGVTGLQGDMGKFKIPSIRNLGFTAPYMHDGRFATLDDVLDFYNEHVKPGSYTDSKMGAAYRGGVHLTVIEKEQIITFLNTLNDSAFVEDPQFSNPD